jgi:hypothetical protein
MALASELPDMAYANLLGWGNHVRERARNVWRHTERFWKISAPLARLGGRVYSKAWLFLKGGQGEGLMEFLVLAHSLADLFLLFRKQAFQNTLFRNTIVPKTFC